MKVHPPCRGCGAAVTNERPVPAGMRRHWGKGLCGACGQRRRGNAAGDEPRTQRVVFQPAPWTIDALCAQTDPEVFYPEKGGDDIRRAKAVCRVCPVRTEYLEYALDNDEAWGVWGGLGVRQRHKIRRGAA